MTLVSLGTGCGDDDATPRDGGHGPDANHGDEPMSPDREHASLVDFGSSQCLRSRDGTPRGSAVEEGTCVNWRYTDGVLTLEVPAVPAVCLENDLLAELPWQASVSAASTSELDVRVVWPSDNTPACGGCLYDFTFEIEMERFDPPVELSVEVRSCPTCDAPAATRNVTLDAPDDAEPQLACQT